MDITEYRSKDARQFLRLVEIAFDAERISWATYDAGLLVAHDIEKAKRQVIPDYFMAEAAVRREKFAELFDRDTAALPKNEEA